MIIGLVSCSGLDTNKQNTEASNNNESSVAQKTTPDKIVDSGESVSLLLNLESDDNIAFSKYDMDVYLDGSKLSTISNGEKYSTKLSISKGSHELKISKSGDESISNSEILEVKNDMTISYMIKHKKKSIEFKKLETKEYIESQSEGNSTSPVTEAQTTEPETEVQTEEITTEKITEKATEKTTEKATEKPKSLDYTTNDSETAKNGNSGQYAYIMDGTNYDIYYIINFDTGYVFRFLEGDGNEGCDKLKIESGDLNSVLIVTYHDGDSTFSNGLHFEFKNRPNTLIMEDNDGFEYTFRPTPLVSAMSKLNTKTITEY